MRKLMSLLLIMTLGLVACTGTNSSGGDTQTNTGGAQSNTDTGNAPTELPQGPNIIIVTRQPTEDFELEVPLPGTMVASATEDPEAGTMFTRIKVERFSGPEGSENIAVEVFGDGQFNHTNGTTGTIDSSKLMTILEELDKINFFGLQGNMIGPSPYTDDFRYRITVERGSNARAINMQEGFYPIVLDEFIDLLFSVGQ